MNLSGCKLLIDEIITAQDDTINVTYHFEKIDNEDTVKVLCTATNKLPTMTFS